MKRTLKSHPPRNKKVNKHLEPDTGLGLLPPWSGRPSLETSLCAFPFLPGSLAF